MLVTHDDESIYIAYSDPEYSSDDNVITLDKSSITVSRFLYLIRNMQSFRYLE